MDPVLDRPAASAQEFAEWVRPHLPAISRLAARLAPDANRDDVVQEALLRAWLKRHQYNPERGTPSTWLLAITADQAAKARAKSRKPTLLAAVPSVAPVSESELDIQRALTKLTERQRLAIDCVYFVGLTVVETAAVMGCAEGTVKSTLADARAKLRLLLEVTG